MSDPGPSTGERAEAARAEIRSIAGEAGHAVTIAGRASERLEAALADGSLRRTAAVATMLADLRLALVPDAASGKVGGKSPEAARFILRALLRAIDEA